MSITPNDRVVAEWLRSQHGDAYAERFLQAAADCPPEAQRRLMHLGNVLQQMFPKPEGGFDFGAGLAFFGLPPLSQLGLSPQQQSFRAGHLIVHMAGHGRIPLGCHEWQSHHVRPVGRPPLIALREAEAPS